eukprot:6684911-Prymnesium_polylepis.1
MYSVHGARAHGFEGRGWGEEGQQALPGVRRGQRTGAATGPCRRMVRGRDHVPALGTTGWGVGRRVRRGSSELQYVVEIASERYLVESGCASSSSLYS